MFIFFLIQSLVFIPAGNIRATTYYSLLSTNWNLASNWGTTGCGILGNTGTFPGAGDDVTLCNGRIPVLPTGTTTIHNLTLSVGAALVIPSGATLVVTGIISNPVPVGSNIAGPGTLQINHGTFVAITLGNTSGTTLNLIVGDGTLSTIVNCEAATASFTNITINALSTLNFTGNILIDGNFTNNGTYTCSLTTMFNGNAIQTISGTSVTTFANLSVNSTVAASGDILQLSQNIIISGNLDLNWGNIYTGSDTVIANGTVTKLAGHLSWVNGNLRKQFTAANLVNTFEVGSTLVYRPVVDTIANVTTGGYLTANNTFGSTNHPSINSSNINPAIDVYTYWTLNPGGGLVFTTSTLQFTYVAADIIGGASPPFFVVESYDRISWTQWTMSASFSPTTTTARTANVVNNMGGFIIGPVSLVLPVELISFTAVANTDVVNTAWATASEINNNYFDVERSSNNTYFESVGNVKGAGTSTTIQNYYLTDAHPLDGISYYRLRQVDYNGKYSYSPIVSVRFGNHLTDIHIYTNPADNVIHLETSFSQTGNVSFEIFDALGKSVMSETRSVTSGNNLLDCNISLLNKGVYYLRLTADDGATVHHGVFVK